MRRRGPGVVRSVGLVASSLALVVGCGESAPRPQWQVFLVTDAPVPQLGDVVLAQVLVESNEGLVPCSACERRFVAGSSERWPLSFGVTPDNAGRPVWLRARLFRSGNTDAEGEPHDDLAIDLLAPLPAADGVTDVVGALAGACVGIRADLTEGEACAGEAGTFGPATPLPLLREAWVPTPNTWAPAAREECTGTPPVPSMRCIEGGLLIMGGREYFPVGDPDFVPLPERLVRVPAFWMDADEVTVGEVKGALGEVPPLDDERCTFDPTSTVNDALPMNCLPRALAEEVCARRRSRLPTEAEWEYAASNAGRETPYPFEVAAVTTKNLCAHALLSVGEDAGMDSCLPHVEARGLQEGGNGLDVNDFGVRNLTGSLSEWVRDSFAPYDDAGCWGIGPEILDAPSCGGSASLVSIRGGSWLTPPATARVVTRFAALPTSIDVGIGFRCVAPAHEEERGS